MSEEEQTIPKGNTNSPDNEQTGEEYAYLDRGGFSSEKFKIEIRGLPKYYGIAVRICVFIVHSKTILIP